MLLLLGVPIGYTYYFFRKHTRQINEMVDILNFHRAALEHIMDEQYQGQIDMMFRVITEKLDDE